MAIRGLRKIEADVIRHKGNEAMEETGVVPLPAAIPTIPPLPLESRQPDPDWPGRGMPNPRRPAGNNRTSPDGRNPWKRNYRAEGEHKDLLLQ